MRYIIDCAFCKALFVPDEKSEIITRFFLEIEESDEVYVPVLWWYEISSVLSGLINRSGLSRKDIQTISRLLGSYNFITDCSHGIAYTETIMKITRTYKLNINSAVYLELGIRMQGKIGTLDKDLIFACRKAGLDTFNLSMP